MKKYITSLLLLGFVTILVGCNSNTSGGLNSKTGLPQQKYLVGGGLMIDYQASCEGTAFLVEKTSARIIKTQSMFKGTNFDGPGSISDEDSQKYFGMPISKLKLELYFVPKPAPNPCEK